MDGTQPTELTAQAETAQAETPAEGMKPATADEIRAIQEGLLQLHRDLIERTGGAHTLGTFLGALAKQFIPEM